MFYLLIVTKTSLLWIAGRPHVHVPMSRYDTFYRIVAILITHSHNREQNFKEIIFIIRVRFPSFM